jgi:TIR domain/Leucine rich repeat
LSLNHISNWYEKVFEDNERLKILNLRNNNINLLTPEMMTDFHKLKFLAIGGNNFVCDCFLREFIERATFNAKVHQCTVNNRRTRRSVIIDEYFDPQYHYEVFYRKYHFYISFADESCRNIMENTSQSSFKSSRRFIEDTTIAPVNCDLLEKESKQPKFPLNFEFLLLDYNENDYHCVDSDGLAKRKVLFNDITACVDRSTESLPIRSTPPYDGFERDEEKEFPENAESAQKNPNILLIIYVSVGIPLTLIIALWFWKRRDIRYFCTIFKNTLILSLDKEDKKALMMTNRRQKSNNNNNDNYSYDVFVSYCDKDREWVLDHLIPNIERRSEVRICLHERDFQVGLSILENIIQCMDQSRCLLLVISESFLKSNWCSFEMHLAQHR